MVSISSTSLVSQTIQNQKQYSFLKSDASNLFNTSGAKLEFIENKGQIVDQYGYLNRDILFMAELPGGAIYVKSDGISFAFYKRDSLAFINNIKTIHKEIFYGANKKMQEAVPLEIYRLDMRFKNSLMPTKITKKEMSDDYFNFYLPQCPDGITFVRKYKTVVLENLYRNIDLVLYANGENKLQYDFVVKSGADPNTINISFEGSDDIEITQNGELIVKTPFGNIEQKAPLAYRPLNPADYINSRVVADNSIIIESKFKKNTDNSVSFEIKNYDSLQTLIIDPPTRLWGTYFGGSGLDEGTSVTTDKMGNVYLSGYSSSIINLSTNGSHKSIYGGSSYQAFLMKFDSQGSFRWSTYYGGCNDDYGRSVTTDFSGNVYLAGETMSTDAISSPGAHQSEAGGNWDAFLVKFNGQGIRQWGTYYGGKGADFGTSLAADPYGSVYLAGTTESDNAISTPGSYQNLKNNSTDAFLVKFDSNGVCQWGTYYGGNDFDEGHSIVTDSKGNVFLAGSTNSTDGIAIDGSHQGSNGGGSDAFLVKFNNNGRRLWSTYYGGDKNDNGYSVTTDGSGNVYLAGSTSSTKSIASLGSYQSSFGGGYYGDAFLVKFSGFGVRLWGTYFGGKGSDEGNSVYADSSGYVYLSGWTTSTNQIATPGTHQITLGGGDDAFLVKFKSNGIRLWGTYFGGSFDDEAKSLIYDNSGNIYLAGWTMSTDAISTAGCYQPVFGGFYDAFLVKFNDSSDSTVSIEISSISDTMLCSGATISISYISKGNFKYGNLFTVQLSDENGSFSHPDSIGALSSITSGSINAVIPSNAIPETGYRLRIVSSNPAVTSKDNGRNITIKSPPTPEIIGDNTVCANSSEIYESNSLLVKNQWFVIGGKINGLSDQRSVSITWGTNTAGTVKLIQIATPACYDSIEFPVLIIPLPGRPTITVNGNELIASPADEYQWYKDSKEITGANQQKYIATSIGNYSVRITQNGCQSDMSDVCYVDKLGISDNLRNFTFGIFPNPANDYISITVGANGCSPESIKIFDVFGQEEHPPSPSYEEGELRVDVSALPLGVYFVRVGNKVQKFLKVEK